MTTSFQPECSQLEIIADVMVDHGGREQEEWGGESKEGRARGQTCTERPLMSFGCHTVYITMGLFFFFFFGRVSLYFKIAISLLANKK